MIFVTVGTHEQPFNRLIRAIDLMKKNGMIQDEVLIQTGYSTYEPQYCEARQWMPFQEMSELVKKADIVITHGGPSSFMMPLMEGKIPVVVPRQKRYREHVNDHQVTFCKAVEARYHNILVINDIRELKQIIPQYHEIVSEFPTQIKSHQEAFNRKLEEIVNNM